MVPTLTEYRQAQHIVSTYKQCDGCSKIFNPNEEGGDTMYYGQRDWWCGEHFKEADEQIKDCMRG